jgi:hypothetical protein
MKKTMIAFILLAIAFLTLTACGSTSNVLDGAASNDIVPQNRQEGTDSSNTPTPTPIPSIMPTPNPTPGFPLEPADMFTYTFMTAEQLNEGEAIRYAVGVDASDYIAVFVHTIFSQGGMVLTSYQGDLTQLTIPDEIEGYPVIAIQSGTFDVSKVTDVLIPDTVEAFEWGLVRGGTHTANDLPSAMIIPYGVTHIIGKQLSEGPWIINGAPNVFSVSMPDTVRYIGAGAFRGFSSLTGIDIPNSVTHMSGNSFYECDSLLRIDFSDNLMRIRTEASGSLINTPWWNAQPDGLVYAGNLAFRWKGDMPPNTHITLKDGTISINDSTFGNQLNLTSIAIPDSVVRIGQFAFFRTSLTDINIPDSVTEIGDWAFSSSSLINVIIPNNITRIAHVMFQDATSLVSVTLPNGITHIGMQAFSGTTSLTDINIPDTVTEIGSNAFRRSSLVSVSLPDGITHIGAQAFYGVTSLTSINIPESIISIGQNAFEGTNLPEQIRLIILAINPYAGYWP